MKPQEVENTISDSKEESIRKALEIVQNNQAEKPCVLRPDVSFLKLFSRFLLWLAFCAFIIVVVIHIGNRFRFAVWQVCAISALLLILILSLKAKNFICCLVLIYQKYAPEKIRRSCLFTPSCSEYMLLAIEKYGVINGCFKGVCRLLRCHHPNGGEDYP